jgi:hypothetical protein
MNSNYSYTIHLYNVLHGGKATQSFVGSRKYPDSTVSCKAMITIPQQNNILWDQCWTKRNLKKDILTGKKKKKN